jgi:hypothetical protein
MLKPVTAVLGLLLLSSAVQASPTHIKRGRHKRSVCATRNVTSSTSTVESEGTTKPVKAFAVVEDDVNGHVGHWQAVTTSVFVCESQYHPIKMPSLMKYR